MEAGKKKEFDEDKWLLKDDQGQVVT